MVPRHLSSGFSGCGCRSLSSPVARQSCLAKWHQSEKESSPSWPTCKCDQPRHPASSSASLGEFACKGSLMRQCPCPFHTCGPWLQTTLPARGPHYLLELFPGKKHRLQGIGCCLWVTSLSNLRAGTWIHIAPLRRSLLILLENIKLQVPCGILGV